jgi:hypothetical protein
MRSAQPTSEVNGMIQLFESVMTVILAYMGYAIYEGSASMAILGLLVIVQALFWSLDFLFVRGGVEEVENMRRVARKLSSSLSKA